MTTMLTMTLLVLHVPGVRINPMDETAGVTAHSAAKITITSALILVRLAGLVLILRTVLVLVLVLDAIPALIPVTVRLLVVDRVPTPHRPRPRPRPRALPRFDLDPAAVIITGDISMIRTEAETAPH